MLATFALTMLFFKKQAAPPPPEVQAVTSWHAFKMRDIDGVYHSMAEYKDKIVLVVNTASKCGLTPQYEGLEALYEKYKDQGFVIVAFPCNDFNGQEPGDEKAVKEFCAVNYKVTFPMYSKLHVKGSEQDAMYRWLVWKSGGKDIEWNFGKILVGRDGQVLARFHPKVTPEDPQVVDTIKAALAK